MRIYEPIGAEGFELCQPARPDDFETIHVQLAGRPVPTRWRPIPMVLIRDDEGKALSMSDSPWLGGHALIFRRTATANLDPLLREYGELLALGCAQELLIFNVTRVVDALDEQASDVRRFSDGRIMRITRHVFRPAVVAGNDIFKIPNLRVSPTFVSQRFVTLWKAAGLRGLDFLEVWAS